MLSKNLVRSVPDFLIGKVFNACRGFHLPDESLHDLLISRGQALDLFDDF
jgi:hypothetical protein